MAVLKVVNKFENSFSGEMIGPRATVPVGSGDGKVSPYDMLFGALASCMYATFLDIMEKKRVPFERVEIEVTGEKRQTPPTTLEWTKVAFTVYGAPEDKQKAFQQSVKLAAKYCSIYQTVGKVADMEATVEFA